MTDWTCVEGLHWTAVCVFVSPSLPAQVVLFMAFVCFVVASRPPYISATCIEFFITLALLILYLLKLHKSLSFFFWPLIVRKSRLCPKCFLLGFMLYTWSLDGLCILVFRTELKCWLLFIVNVADVLVGALSGCKSEGLGRSQSFFFFFLTQKHRWSISVQFSQNK